MAFLTVAVVFADNNVHSTKYDGRLNMADCVGNHAVYCIDHNGLPTSDGWTDGGLHVLDGNGQVVFLAPAAEIEAPGVPTENAQLHSEGLCFTTSAQGGPDAPFC